MLRRISSASTSTFSSLVRGSSGVSSPLEATSEGDFEADSRSHTTVSKATSSSAIDTGLPNLDALTLANQQLVSSLESLQAVHRSAYSQRLSLLAIVQHILTEEPETRDTFREHGGFLNIISALASLDERTLQQGDVEGSDTLQVRSDLRFELVKLVFAILSVSFSHNTVNRTTFLDTVGFDAVGEAIKLSRLAESPVDDEDDAHAAEKLLSVLYDFLKADFSTPNLFSQIRVKLDEAESSTSDRYARIDGLVRALGGERIRNPEVLPLFLDIQSGIEHDELRYTVLAILNRLVDATPANLALLCEHGLTRILIDRIFDDDYFESKPASEKDVSHLLLSKTLRCGLATAEARTLVKLAVAADGKRNQDVLDLLLEGIAKSRGPPSLHFDLSSSGYAAVQVPALGKPFPPATYGYTFLAWIHITTPPLENEAITLLGCSDEAGRSFVEISLSSDGNLTLATSSTRSPVTFDGFTFETDKWYHVAIVHQRPKYSSSSPVAFYVDGKLVDTVKALYPTVPNKDISISAWLGTPKDRVVFNQLGKGKTAIQWDLGPCWLLHGDLNEDLVFLCHSLGPRYSSNFQDRLGQFQTNASSSLINVRLDRKSREGQDSPYAKSPLAYAAKEKGSAAIPEQKLYFCFSALNVIEDVASNDSPGSSKDGRYILNSAVDPNQDGGGRFAEVKGDTTVIKPQGIDVAIWKTGGVAIILRLVEVTTTTEQLIKALRLFYEYVKESWRNSEDAERNSAYEILTHLLKAKTALINSDVHDLLFTLAGYDFEDSIRSVVANQAATRFILLDFALWVSANVDLQWAHFDRLREMVARSEHAAYNAKRLSKMHLSRKLLFALRIRSLDEQLEGEAVTLLMTMLKAHFGTEKIRNIATWLTASLCAENGDTNRHLSEFVTNAAQLAQTSADRAPLSVLQSLHDMLLDPYYHRELDKFARVITTKWSLLFLMSSRSHPLAAVLSLRILARVLQTQDHGFVTRFAHSDDGFLVLRKAVANLWHCSQVYTTLFALLRDIDITTIPLETSFASVLESDKARPQTEWSVEYMRCIVSCYLKGLEWCDNQTQPDTSSSDEGESLSSRVGLRRAISTFGAFLDADGSNETANLLLDSVPLSELASGLSSLLRCGNAAPPADGLPIDMPLPILSSRNGFAFSSRLSPSASRESTSSTARRNTTANVPDIVIPDDSLTAEPDEMTNASKLDQRTDTTEEAVELLDILAQHVYKSITTRSNSSKRSLSLLDRATSSFPEGPLQMLGTLFDAFAFHDRPAQVVARTLILKRLVHRLRKAPVTPLVVPRIAQFIRSAVDYCLQGWCVDPLAILDFTCAYVERVVDITAVDSEGSEAANVKLLFASLNRLVLFCLVDSNVLLSDVLKLLVHHQMALFSMLNGDAQFFACLVERLCLLIQTSEGDVQSSVIDFFKLFLLQRPREAEEALNEKPLHDSEARFVAKLIDAERDAFVPMLAAHQADLLELHQHWEAFVEYEVARLLPSLEDDLRSVDELAGANAIRTDQALRRYRKHEKSFGEWADGIREVEATRMSHNRQDIMDHAIYIESEWTSCLRSLKSDRTLFSEEQQQRKWRLDFTEGHCRMRKKLEAEEVEVTPSRLRAGSTSRDKRMGVKRNDSMSFDRLQTDTAPSPLLSPASAEDDSIWRGETFPASEQPARLEHDDMPEEDKNRKVRRSLEPGDVIEAVYNTNRIDGLDAFPCLLLFAKRNIYLVDGYFQRENGELVDASDALPEERDQHLQTLSDLAGRGSKRAQVVLYNDHRARQWPWTDLVECHERNYLFRNVALELFFADGRSFLLTFSKDQRAYAFDTITTRCPAAVAVGSLHVASASLGELVADVVMGQRTKLEIMSKKWERREVSNFEYLMFLNTCAGRTYNDVTNYPVFPWIIADWTSDELDLTKESTFRDLSKPMGAQTEARKREFEERYAQLAELDDGNAPWHYGSHYSSAMIVVGYLIRLRPFTDAYLDLQGGSFDHADRMFWSLAKAWDSASRHSRSDVREIIPEFFYLPDFLVNSNGLELGRRQENDTPIDDVELPPWAKGSPRLFVEKHREALECDFVSRHLHAWIDLVFGYKQKGQAAVEATNVFQALSYEGAIDLDTIEDADERRAATSTIHNFGMTPRQLFTRPHIQRPSPLVPKGTLPLFSPDTPIEDQTAVMIESCVPVHSIPSEVARIHPSPTIEKTMAVPRQTLLLPGDSMYSISWGFPDQSVRVHAKGHALPVSLFESLQSEQIKQAVWADSRTFVSASTDTTVCLWRWRWKSAGRDGELKQVACLRGHEDAIVSLAASREYSIVVSGSEDKSAIVWDLNRHEFVHRLEGHEFKVGHVAISDTTGDIATCSGSVLRVWTINGELLATQSTSNFSDPITCVAWSLSETDPMIATGHRYGVIKLWKRHFSPLSHSYSLSLMRTLTSENPIEVSSLVFGAKALFIGHSSGLVYTFAPPNGTDLYLPDSRAPACMVCGTKFALLENRKRCCGCGRIVCSLDSTSLVPGGGRFCVVCVRKLSPYMILD